MRKLAESMMPYVIHYLNSSIFPDIERFLYELSARIVIMAYIDLSQSKSGFFGVLLGSIFARPMSPEARLAWEDCLELDHKVVKQCPEHLNPFISVHRAALAFSHKWGLETLKKKPSDDRILKVSESASTSYRRHSELQRALHDEADSIPGLLAVFAATAPPPPPRSLPRRILHNSPNDQPAIPVAPKQAQRKRGRGVKPTVPEDGGISKAKKPKVAPKLPTQTQTATVISNPPKEIAASESNSRGSTSGKKRKIAGSGSAKPDLSKDNEKKRKATATSSSNRSAHPEPQENAAGRKVEDPTDPQEDENNVTTKVEEDDSLRKLKPTPPPIQYSRFSTVGGRIVPSGKRTTVRAMCDHFNEAEQLALYTRYKEVVTAQRAQGGHQTTAKQWFEMCQDIANVLPGRGVIGCIEFYVENQENFKF